MVVVWQTTLLMLTGQMQDRPLLLKAARRSLIRSCHASLPRIQLFEPEFRWRLTAATSEEDIERTMSDFNRVAAERPWRKRTKGKALGVSDLLPGAGSGNFFLQSIALANRVQTALAAAATGGGHTQQEVSELLGRLDKFNELSAVSPVSRAELIRVLAPHRSIGEIETIARELGKLSILHASEIVALADDFDSLLRMGGLSASDAPRLAEELHTMSAAGGPLAV